MTAPALRFAGAGWYVNDYAGKGAAKTGDAAETPAVAAKTETKADSGGSDAASVPAATPAAAPASAAPSTASGAAASGS